MSTYESLALFVRDWCKYEDAKRQRIQTLRRLECEINWLYARLDNPQYCMTPAQRGEYMHQIRHHELEIAFLDLNR